MRVLKGERIPLVKRWQLFLLGQGFSPCTADGIFGEKPRAATMAFQREHGLRPDGATGNRTFGFQVLEDRGEEEEGPNWSRPASRSLVGIWKRQEVFGAFTYALHPTLKGYITILRNCERANITSVEVPQLRGMEGTPRSGSVPFHRLAARQLAGLWRLWHEPSLMSTTCRESHE